MKYKCYLCKKEFLLGEEDDKEAIKEFKKDYPGYDINSAGVICDSCYDEYSEMIKGLSAK